MDIICKNHTCMLRHHCLRYKRATAHQWVTRFEPTATRVKSGDIEETIYDCDHFIDNKPYIHQTK